MRWDIHVHVRGNIFSFVTFIRRVKVLKSRCQITYHTVMHLLVHMYIFVLKGLAIK